MTWQTRGDGIHCVQCRHLMDPHVMYRTGDTAQDGGIILCPVKDCQCLGTWGVGDTQPPVMPHADVIAQLRELAQQVEAAQ